MFNKEVAAGIHAVRKAAHLSENIASVLDHEGTVTKDDCSPVTIADYAVQAVIHRDLNRIFPQDPITAEEDAVHLSHPENRTLLSRLMSVMGASNDGWNEADLIAHVGRGRHEGGRTGRFWTLDPIDGTKGFLRGDQYAVALALIEDGHPVVGILGCPRLELPVGEGVLKRGWICWAVRGKAVAESLDGETQLTLHTSLVQATQEIRLCESLESAHSAHGKSRLIADDLKITRPPLRMDSQAKYAAVAAGVADVYLRLPTRGDYREKIWDHAAGVLLVEAAGGNVCDVDGKSLNFGCGRTLQENRGIVATAHGVHASVVDAVKNRLAIPG